MQVLSVDNLYNRYKQHGTLKSSSHTTYIATCISRDPCGHWLGKNEMEYHRNNPDDRRNNTSN